MKRRKFSSKFKTKVVLEALKERQSLNELGMKYSIAPQQISKWKQEFILNAESLFSNSQKTKRSEAEEEREKLLRTIGELKVENDYLKKKLL